MYEDGPYCHLHAIEQHQGFESALNIGKELWSESDVVEQKICEGVGCTWNDGITIVAPHNACIFTRSRHRLQTSCPNNRAEGLDRSSIM